MNFATGDWFPFGSVASKHYSLLKRSPLLPYEELLCNEALVLNKRLSSADSLSLVQTKEFSSCISIMISFVQLMRFHHHSRWLLMTIGARMCHSSYLTGTVLCSICRRDCYVSYFQCYCNLQPICLHHGKDKYKMMFR